MDIRLASMISSRAICGSCQRASRIPSRVLESGCEFLLVPDLFELIIALASGAAGAIAVISPRVGVALVGVATALVPPLAAAGILLARADFLLGGRLDSRRDQRHRHPVCLFGNFWVSGSIGGRRR